MDIHLPMDGSALRRRRTDRSYGSGASRRALCVACTFLALLPFFAVAYVSAVERSGSDLVVFNFQDADLELVLDAVASTIGFNYVLAPEVRRKVTLQGRLPRQKLFDVLMVVLEVEGLTAVRAGDIYKIIRIATAQSEGLPVTVGPEVDPRHGSTEIVTHIAPLNYGAAAEIAKVLQPMVSKEGTIVVYRDTNVLVITDMVEKLRRHLQIARSLDVPTPHGQIQVLPLRSANATTLAPLLGQLFAGAPSGTSLSPSPSRTPTGDLSDRDVPAVSGRFDGSRDSSPARPVILAEPRTNSLLLAGPSPVVDRIRAVAAQLDTEVAAPVHPKQSVFLYRVEHLRAKELGATLTGLLARRSAQSATARDGARLGSLPQAPAPQSDGGLVKIREDVDTENFPDGDVRVIADEPTNTLVIASSEPTWAALQPVLERLDRMPRRVLIELLVAEVTLDDSTSLGIEWSLRSGGIKIGGERFSLTSGLDTGAPGIVPLPPTFFFILKSSNVLTLLQAFSKVDRVNVLSTPHVLTSENKRAQIHVGQSVPILTSQQQPTVGIAPLAQPTSVITTTVEYRDTGIILTVTPRVSADRLVALDIRQEVSDAVPNAIGGTQSPIFTKRVAETSVVVAEHETLVLGGLIEERKIRSREGIPFLSRIPILGYLFGTTTESVRKTELLILVTPRLVWDPAQSESLHEELKGRMPELRRELEPPRPIPPVPPASTPRGNRSPAEPAETAFGMGR